MSATGTDPWERRVVRRVKSFIGSIFERPQRDLPSGHAGRLPFHLYLSMGVDSFPLFPQGPIDEFRFFQRVGVPGHHEVEFLSRLDPDAAGPEDFRPYGIFRLQSRRALPLYEQEEVVALWATLKSGYGLSRAPHAQRMAPDGFSSFDMRRGNRDQGCNRLSPKRNARIQVRAGRRRMTYAQILEILREEMSPSLKIAWIEDAFQDEPLPGEIVHRYYLTANKELFLVRHHWKSGKLLFQAETSEEARQICLSSGIYSRPARKAA